MRMLRFWLAEAMNVEDRLRLSAGGRLVNEQPVGGEEDPVEGRRGVFSAGAPVSDV
jgi:hypothetical protein